MENPVSFGLNVENKIFTSEPFLQHEIGRGHN